MLFFWKMYTKVGTEDHSLLCWERFPHPIRPSLGWKVAQFSFQLYVVVLGQMLNSNMDVNTQPRGSTKDR